MKPTVDIIGNLGYPVEIGYRAFIRQEQGTMLLTSQVVAVRNQTENGVEIETQNTIYKLTYSNRYELPRAV